jgi:NADH-quinone oxidoreductase subunit G
MADSGRELYKQVEDASRITSASVKGNKTSLDVAFNTASEIIKSGHLAIVGSGHLTVEEQYLLSDLAKKHSAKTYVPAHTGKGDGMLISEDHTPNFRGSLVTGLTQTASVDLKALSSDIEAGKVKSLLICREDVTTLGISAQLLSKVRVVVIATHKNATTDAAEVVLPGLTVFERSGSFINCQFRLQSFAQAIPGPAGTLPDSSYLARFAGLNVDSIWKELSQHVPALAGLAHGKIPEDGVVIDSSKWSSITFPEGRLLKFAPAGVTA